MSCSFMCVCVRVCVCVCVPDDHIHTLADIWCKYNVKQGRHNLKTVLYLQMHCGAEMSVHPSHRHTHSLPVPCCGRAQAQILFARMNKLASRWFIRAVWSSNKHGTTLYFLSVGHLNPIFMEYLKLATKKSKQKKSPTNFIFRFIFYKIVFEVQTVSSSSMIVDMAP